VIRRAVTDAELERCVTINNAVNPDSPVVLADLREQPRGGRFLLHDADGYAYVVRSSVPGSAYVMVRVHPDARRRGIGSALLKAAADEARELGFDSMWGRVQPDDETSLAFVRQRGFEEAGRDVILVRELAADEGEVAEGIAELREDHRHGAYAVAVEAIPDMAVDPPAAAGTYEDWAAEALSGPVAFVALDGGRVVGYASLHELRAQPHRLEHGLTGVLRSHRGRGLAQALKRAQIVWAARHGYRELVTETQLLNAPMRAVNAKLGYVERPGAVEVRAWLR
jgi:GNAT superfamily N-acetyltransferase